MQPTSSFREYLYPLSPQISRNRQTLTRSMKRFWRIKKQSSNSSPNPKFPPPVGIWRKVPPSPFCHLCRLYDKRKASICAYVSSFREGAQQRCPSCLLVTDCIDWALNRIPELHEDLISLVILQLKDGLILDTGKGSMTLDCMENSTGKFVSMFKDSICPRLPATTGSNTAVLTIKEWISQCASEHTECNTIQHVTELSGAHHESQLKYPVRMLDVRNDSVILRENLQLYEQRYAALSHCWGTGSQANKVMTTAETIQQFKEGIPWELLSNVFQEAIITCRRLSITHLWIDTFAILQDSVQDWEEQSSQMAAVYENAFITMAATNAANGSMGLFRKTDPQFHIHRIPCYDRTFVRVKINSRPFVETPDEAWPLHSRAWVCQELLLSRRVIHFSAQQLTWECKRSAHGQTTDFVKPDKPTIQDQSEKEQSVVDYWHQYVSDYTRKNITFERDKLPALAAIASKMQQRRGNDKYLAGLWLSSLLSDLLWETLPAADRRTTAHGIPTWSWASVPTHVLWSSPYHGVRRMILPDVRVIGNEYVTRGSQFTGEIKLATVTLSGYLITLKRFTKPEQQRPLADTKRVLSATFKWDVASDHDKMQEVLFLAICRQFGNAMIVDGGLAGLLLERVGDSSRFKRVGRGYMADFPYLAPISWQPSYHSHRRSIKSPMELIKKMDTEIVTLI